jgi:hypothetical protein
MLGNHSDRVRDYESFLWQELYCYIAKNTVIPAWMLESSHKDVKQCYEVYYL